MNDRHGASDSKGRLRVTVEWGGLRRERLNRYAIYASGWTVFGIWPDTEHGPPGCIYGIPVKSLIIKSLIIGDRHARRMESANVQ